MLCEMQSVSFRIWTRVAVFIYDDDNHYTTGTSLIAFIKALSSDNSDQIILPNKQGPSLGHSNQIPGKEEFYTYGQSSCRICRKEDNVDDYLS